MERLLQSTNTNHPPISDAQKSRVEHLARLGATEKDIAIELDIPLSRLRKLCRRELKRGAVAGKHQVLEALFASAHSGSNFSATSLWVKARCGWRDTGAAAESSAISYAVLEVVKSNEEVVKLNDPAGR